jgi:hypothetical protein
MRSVDYSKKHTTKAHFLDLQAQMKLILNISNSHQQLPFQFSFYSTSVVFNHEPIQYPALINWQLMVTAIAIKD